MKLALQSEMAITNDDVRQLDRSYVFHSWSMQGNLNPLVIAGAQGCELWDYDGNTYLDFSSQLVNVNIGYQHPRVLAAMKAQLEELTTIAPATANLARGEAAKRIVDLAPEGFSKVFFTNAGADANETPCVWRVCIPDATRFFLPTVLTTGIPVAPLWPRAIPVVFRMNMPVGTFTSLTRTCIAASLTPRPKKKSASAHWRICAG
jgi:hypothetical protein